MTCEHGYAGGCSICAMLRVTDAMGTIQEQRARISELEREREGLRKALEAVAEALKEPRGGSFWLARRFLDERGVYHGDLSGNSVLGAVARSALSGAPKEGT